MEEPTTQEQPRKASRTSARFVGRHGELNRLESAREHTLESKGAAFVTISGEPGIEKTWLSSEFADLARRRDCLALGGSCYEGGRHSPTCHSSGRGLRRDYRDEELTVELAAGAPELAARLPGNNPWPGEAGALAESRGIAGELGRRDPGSRGQVLPTPATAVIENWIHESDREATVLVASFVDDRAPTVRFG